MEVSAARKLSRVTPGASRRKPLQRRISDGHLADVHPYHLIFSIWSLTQHYADFDVQVRAVLGKEDPFEAAGGFLDTLYRRLLAPSREVEAGQATPPEPGAL